MTIVTPEDSMTVAMVSIVRRRLRDRERKPYLIEKARNRRSIRWPENGGDDFVDSCVMVFQIV